MFTSQLQPWVDPLELASGIDEPYWVLLYSGVQASYSGRYSYLACSLAERVEGHDFSALAAKLTSGGATFDNAWFGYLGYGLKDCLETLAPDHPNWLNLPNLCMIRFHTIYQFDHLERKRYALVGYSFCTITHTKNIRQYNATASRIPPLQYDT